MARLPAALGLCLLIVVQAGAASPPDPLRFVSDKADVVIKIENPRKLVETVTSLAAFKDAEKLEPVRQFLDTAQARRFFEFIAYCERDFGAKWPELLEKLAGGGIVLGGKINKIGDDAVLLAIQATDEQVLGKFVDRAVGLIEQEMGLVEAKKKLTREKYQDFEILHIGMDFRVCRIGAALLFSNKIEVLKGGIDQHMENISISGKPARNMLNSPSLAAAHKLLPPNPQLWLWYGFDYVKTKEEFKNVLTTPRNDLNLTFIAAGVLDVVRRADFVAAGLYENQDGMSLSLRMPAGRERMAEDVELHLPRDAKISGSLPLLEPKGVMFSHSFYLDLGVLWSKREKIMSAQNVKDFEKNAKQASRFLLGTSVDKLLTQAGPYHRLVAVSHRKQDYKIEPKLKLPAFAYVASMRDPAFGKSVQALLRGGAFFLSTQVSLKFFEDKQGETPLFGYRFPEDGKFPDDPQGIRFNFTPTFAVVNDQLIAASSVDLCKELIEIVRLESRSQAINSNMRLRLDAKGGADFLNASPEGLLAQTILSQAISEAEAKKQVDALLKYIQNLGTLNFETNYSDKEFRFDIVWKINK